MKLSVVIPTWNRPSLVRRILLQLCEQTTTGFEVVVVDDGSAQSVAESLADLRPPWPLRILRQKNAGAAAARHQGALSARGELLLFVDDDMQVGRDFVARHLAAHEGAGRTVVLGRIRADPGLGSMPFFERWHSRLLDRKAQAIADGSLEPRGHLLFSGNASLRRDDYLAVGGFDFSLENSEDVELGLRLEKAGVAFRFCEAAWTLHGSDHTSVSSWRRRARRYGACDHRIAGMHSELRHASPWRFAVDMSSVARPFIAAAVLAPRAAGVAAGLSARAASVLDRLRLERPSLQAATLAYALEYFRGVREAAGSREKALEEWVGFLASFEDHAAARALADLREDQAITSQYEAKHGHPAPASGELSRDAVEKIGLQIMAAYRLMRALRAAGSTLAAKVVSRLIRHLYGSDIHWDAELAPGVMIVHGMGLAISRAARVGRGCILFQNVTLGMGTDPETRRTGAPLLEGNVHVGPGATLLGPIVVGEGSKVMAGAVLTRSVPPGSLVAAPSPEVRPRLRDLSAA